MCTISDLKIYLKNLPQVCACKNSKTFKYMQDKIIVKGLKALILASNSCK